MKTHLRGGRLALLLSLFAPSIFAQPATFRQVTSAADIVTGGRYLIVNEANNVAMGAYDKNKNQCVPRAVTIENDRVTTEYNTTTSLPYTFQLEKMSGYWRIRIENTDKFLGVDASTPTNLTTSASIEDKYQKWDITFDKDTHMVNIHSQSLPSDPRKMLYYHVDYGAFKNYDTPTLTSNLSLYRQCGSVTIGTAEGYGTFYSATAYVMPAGMKGATVSSAVDGVLTLDYVYPSGSIVPAETPLLLRASAPGTYTFFTTTLQGKAPGTNYLRGTLTDADIPADDAHLYYKLTYLNGRNLGFYWGEAQGGSFRTQGGKAYLALPAAISSSVKGFALDGPSTGLIGLPASPPAAAPLYDLSGRRQPVPPAARGLFIRNGRKIIRR